MAASLEAEYGIDLRSALAERVVSVLDLAGRVRWLPPGCAFWRSYGGPNALSQETQAIEFATYQDAFLAWAQGGRHGPEPKPLPYPPFAFERRQQEDRAGRAARAVREIRERRGD